MTAGRWVALVVIGLLAGLFAHFNAGQRVALGLGFTTLYRVPMAHLVLGAFLLGMVTMFLIGMRQDMELRRRLRERDVRERQASDDTHDVTREEPHTPAW
jgi:uncharacterized integral membrane protein